MIACLNEILSWPGADGLTLEDVCKALANRNGLDARAMQASENEPAKTAADRESCRLSRWLVSFGSESGWYRVGEFVAREASAAIERAVEVFGPGAAYQAVEIPWDAAPLSKAKRIW